ncbi:uncharacterized protein LOC106172736 [Lingula anatina]|uniref:Uncharacterized protein LOC106172736 n=1 Tax=Lingula anatina TaxID=7574 RepID=A0A1S3JFB1_LINAN|nr:uncharacterized protein LOC106172736 [Lingula anatina]|eukprot:XP_013409028.1 uncharacterized protein LOC106172736 [Lingula anatina]
MGVLVRYVWKSLMTARKNHKDAFIVAVLCGVAGGLSAVFSAYALSAFPDVKLDKTLGPSPYQNPNRGNTRLLEVSNSAKMTKMSAEMQELRQEIAKAYPENTRIEFQ